VDVKKNRHVVLKSFGYRSATVVQCLVMDDSLVSKVLSEIGRRGGKARAKKLTAEQRRKSAIKASKAAAKARTRKAKERKRVRESEK
jgi:hypothetical protein